ncbi:MAG: hypothetical protein HN745_14670 [Deltaproteobacteria bacterium]|jgi:hypothetical protein|nr:hypothetical protein [Deltaproteobacteria bacterium]
MCDQAYTRKRPCSVCRRWFRPHPRLKDRQRTCGDPECKREWHRIKCGQWNKRNGDYFKTNYLQKKVESQAKNTQIKTRLKTGLPKKYVQEVIGMHTAVIIEYLAQLMVQRFQEVMRRQMAVNKRKTPRLMPTGFQDSIDCKSPGFL